MTADNFCPICPVFPAARPGRVHAAEAGALLSPGVKGALPGSTVAGVPLCAVTVFGVGPDADTTATPSAHTTPAASSTMAAAAVNRTVRDTRATSGDARAGDRAWESRGSLPQVRFCWGLGRSGLALGGRAAGKPLPDRVFSARGFVAL